MSATSRRSAHAAPKTTTASAASPRPSWRRSCSSSKERTADDDFAASFRLRDGFFKHRYDTWHPRQLVSIAMRHEPYSFEPGKPLHLHDTTAPGTGARMPQPSSRAYSKLADKTTGPSYDVTEFNPSAAWTSGGMISDSGDLNRFYSALLRGKLLPKKQLAEMKTTVPMGEAFPGARYGLGLAQRELSCGRQVWGHHGGILGSTTEAVTTEDGRHSLAFNFNGDWTGDSDAVLGAEFCGP